MASHTTNGRYLRCKGCGFDKPLAGGHWDKPPQYGGRLICADCSARPENVRYRVLPVAEHHTNPCKD